MTDQSDVGEEAVANRAQTVPGEGAGSGSVGAAAVGQPEGEAAPKRPRGAPKGNRNALTTGLHSGKPARELRDAPARAAERAVRDVLTHYNLDGDPLARLVGRQLRRLEAAAGRLEAKLERRGYFTAKGEPHRALTSMVDVTDRLLGECRRLLDQLAAGAKRPDADADVLYRAEFHDGSPIVFGSPQGPAEGVLIPGAADPVPLREGEVLAAPGVPKPSRRATARKRPTPPRPPAVAETIEARAQALRDAAWRNGSPVSGQI